MATLFVSPCSHCTTYQQWPVRLRTSCLWSTTLQGTSQCFNKLSILVGYSSSPILLPRQICMLNDYSYVTSLAADPIWPIKPHPAQTSGSVFMDQEGGVGKAVCAAYKEDPAPFLQYFVCRIPNGTTAEEAACLYNRRNLTCYQCAGGSIGLNSTFSTSVSDLGIETDSCRLNIWVEGRYMCLAQRQWWNGSTSIAQHIGSFNVSQPVPQPTPHLSVCATDSSLRTILVSVIVVLALATVCWIIIAICCCICLRKPKYRRVPEVKDPCKLPLDQWHCLYAVHLACNDVGPPCDPYAACTTDVSERSRLLQWVWGRRHNPALKSNPATSTVTILCRAQGDSEFTRVPCRSVFSDNPFHLECGKEYQIQFKDGQVVQNVVVATPEDRSE